MNNIRQELNRYVIATLTTETLYLRYFGGQYSFVDNLIECSKTTQRSLAEEIKMNFYKDTKLIDIELVVLPLKIEYKLINETENKY